MLDLTKLLQQHLKIPPFLTAAVKTPDDIKSAIPYRLRADAAGGFPLSGARSWDVQHLRAHGMTASKWKHGQGRFREAWDADAAASSREKKKRETELPKVRVGAAEGAGRGQAQGHGKACFFTWNSSENDTHSTMGDQH